MMQLDANPLHEMGLSDEVRGTLRKLEDWLFASGIGVEDCVSCAVKIKRTVYPAVKFAAITDNPSQSRQSFYCLGELPKCYVRSARTAFNFVNSRQAGRDWFIAGWFAREGAEERFNLFHPFGNHFYLDLWYVSPQIDDQCGRAYNRVPTWVYTV